MRIGEHTKAWRKRADLIQSEVARELGISQARLSLFENDDSRHWKPLGEMSAIRLQELSNGAVLAVDCVSPEKRERVAKLTSRLRKRRGVAA